MRYLSTDQVDAIIRQSAAALEERALRAQIDVEIAQSQGAPPEQMMALVDLQKNWENALHDFEERYREILRPEGESSESSNIHPLHVHPGANRHHPAPVPSGS